MYKNVPNHQPDTISIMSFWLHGARAPSVPRNIHQGEANEKEPRLVGGGITTCLTMSDTSSRARWRGFHYHNHI